MRYAIVARLPYAMMLLAAILITDIFDAAISLRQRVIIFFAMPLLLSFFSLRHAFTPRFFIDITDDDA